MNRIHHTAIVPTPDSSRQIGERAAQQRLAHNSMVDYLLAHPSATASDLEQLLIIWRHREPARWSGSLALHRPGITTALKVTRQYLKAWQADPAGPHTADALLLTRQDPTELVITAPNAIALPQPDRLTADGIPLQLDNPVPAGYDVIAVKIHELAPDDQQHHRPLSSRVYRAHLTLQPQPAQRH